MSVRLFVRSKGGKKREKYEYTDECYRDLRRLLKPPNS